MGCVVPLIDEISYYNCGNLANTLVPLPRETRLPNKHLRNAFHGSDIKHEMDQIN